MRSLAERIQLLAEQFGDAATLADKAGINRSTLYGWLKGRDPRSTDLTRLLEATGCDPAWLLGFKDEFEARKDIAVSEARLPASDQMIGIPRFEIQAAAGSGSIPMSFDPEDSFYVSRQWLYRFVPPNVPISMIEVAGDSMDPTIRDGDVLLLRHDRNAPQSAIGNVVVLTLDDLLYVKRLQGGERGELLLTSDNDFYTAMRVPLSEWDSRARIHGLAFWHGGPIRKR